MLDAEQVRLLALPLNPERVIPLPSGHPAAGEPYLPIEDVVRRANEIFGFGGWSSEVAGQPWVIGPGQADGKNEVWAAVVRVTIPATGASYSDMGTNTRSGPGAAALEMAAKGAISDGVKRCLVYLGDQFGLVLRDRHIDRATLHAHWSAAMQQGGGAAQPQRQPATTTSLPPEWVDELAALMHEAGLKLADLTAIIPVASIARENAVAVVGGFLAGEGMTPAQLVQAVLNQREAGAQAAAETEAALPRTQFERALERLDALGMKPGQVSPLLRQEIGKGQFNAANVDEWCAKTGRHPADLVDLARDLARHQPAGAGA